MAEELYFEYVKMLNSYEFDSLYFAYVKPLLHNHVAVIGISNGELKVFDCDYLYSRFFRDEVLYETNLSNKDSSDVPIETLKEIDSILVQHVIERLVLIDKKLRTI